MCLEEQGYVISTTGEYPVLKALPGCRGILSGKEKFEIRIAKEKIPAKKKQDRSDADIDASLLDKLRTLRRELADKANMPAYIIFSNAALIRSHLYQSGLQDRKAACGIAKRLAARLHRRNFLPFREWVIKSLSFTVKNL